MYKVFHVDQDQLWSVIHSFTNVDVGDMPFMYSPYQWNRGKYPFLGFTNEEDACEFAIDMSSDHYRERYEVWYCHARGIREISHLIPVWLSDFIDQAKELWTITKENGGQAGSHLVSMLDIGHVPPGTRACDKIKPVERIAVLVDGLYL